MKPRRTILSVPGHVEKMHRKAAQSQADVIMLDLEDSVPPDAKRSARAQVVNALRTGEWGEKTLAVRINSVDSEFAYQDIIEVAEGAGNRIDSLVIPKVEHPGDIHFADRLLNGIEAHRGLKERIRIEASIESPGGLECVSEISRASDRVISLVFGIADYSASVGARLVSISGHGESEAELYPGHRWHFAMSRIIMAARANGLLAIDAPFGNFRDGEGLRRSAVMACALGYDGKWVIHPDQIPAVNRVFMPSEAEIDRAEKVLKAFASAESAGRGAVAVEGRMVDQATVRMARLLYEQAKYLGLK